MGRAKFSASMKAPAQQLAVGRAQDLDQHRLNFGGLSMISAVDRHTSQAEASSLLQRAQPVTGRNRRL